MKKGFIVLWATLLPLLSSAQWADDIYYSADDAPKAPAAAKQKPTQAEVIYKNGARKIVYLDEYTKYNSKKAKADTIVALDSVEQSTYEYAQRIKRFHRNSASVIISDPSNDDVYYLDGNYWNVYDNDGYTSISPDYGWNSWYGYNSYYPWYSGWGYPYWGWRRPYLSWGWGWYDPYWDWNFGWSGYYGWGNYYAWGYPYYGWGYGHGYGYGYGYGYGHHYDYRPSGYYGNNRRNQYNSRTGSLRTGSDVSRTRETSVGSYRTGVRLSGTGTRTGSGTRVAARDNSSLATGAGRIADYAISGRRTSESGISTTPRVSGSRTATATSEGTARSGNIYSSGRTSSDGVRSNTYGGRSQSGAVRSSGSYTPSQSRGGTSSRSGSSGTYSAPSRSGSSSSSRSSGSSYSGSSSSRSSGGSSGGSRSSGGRR
ncbi:MAG: hypothetical protein LBS01_09585 [Prevotellaceae bacterium]|jgi:hypothetical protein|nr:hypothetical protein [Prevotellaceae bacterium]